MKKIILLSLAFLLAVAGPSNCKTITVRLDSTGDYTTIQAAINAAVDGDVVTVAEGTYTGDGNRDIDFLGKAITVRSINPNDPEVVAATIIDCYMPNISGYPPRMRRGFYFTNNEDVNSVVAGFTVIEAYDWNGSGIYCAGSSPTIANCAIVSNTALTYGGGILCSGGSPTITNCTISGNSADYGGGIYCRDSSPTITNCTVSGNSAEHGGGIYCSTGIIIKNSVITGNWSDKGGGIYSHDGTNVIENCTFSGNRAVDAGGGFYCFFPSADDVPPFYDQPPAYDGQPWGPLPPLPLPGPPSGSKIINSIFWGNISDRGPQVAAASAYAPSPPPWPPSPPEWPDWLDRFKRYPDSVSDEQTEPIITDWPSRPWPSPPDWPWPVPPWWPPEWPWPPIPPSPPWPPSPPPRPPHPRVISIKYSDIQGSQDGVYTDSGWRLNWGSGNTNADPCFVEPGYWDVNDLWVEGDYHILEDSPCINTGDPDYVPEPNDTDRDGRPRILLGRVDMGAYEFNHIPVADAGQDQIVYAWIDWIAEVTLDGSGSYDEDGHPLTYLWSWIIDGNSFTATGQDPAIELPVGELTIELIVNDGIDDSEPDEVVITVVPPVEAAMKLTPQALNCNSKGKYIKAHLTLPEGFLPEDVDVNAPAMAEPMGAESEYIKVLGTGTGPVRLEIAFDREAFCETIIETGEVEVAVIGSLTTSRYFYATDTIRIKP